MACMIGTMTDTNDMTGDQFAQGLKALGWRQVEFADRTGTSPSTVNRWIAGFLPVPAWAAAHLRLLLAADQFHRDHVAPPPRTRRRRDADEDQGER